MNLTISVYLDEVVALLSVAAVAEPKLLEMNLSKPQIKAACLEVIKRRGTETDGWDDDLREMRAAEVNGWAYAQAARYTW